MQINPLQVIIPCVDYADILEHTLPITKRHFKRILVVSSEEDDRTTNLCLRENVEVFLTEAWFSGAARFNKAAALNEAIADALNAAAVSWILILDADIVFPENFVLNCETLDPLCLYSVPRRLCLTEDEWRNFSNGTEAVSSFPLYQVPIKDGKAWGNRPTANPAGLLGYFQLWNAYMTGKSRFPDSPSASSYDVEFALTFSEEHRKYIDNLEVIHLGPLRTNWNGRLSPWWNPSKSKAHLPSRAQFVLSELRRHKTLDSANLEYERMSESRKSVFLLRAGGRELYLKLFLESQRDRVLKEEIVLEQFAQIVTVPDVIASSANNIYRGAPFLLTNPLPSTFVPIASEMNLLQNIDPIVSHFADRLHSDFHPVPGIIENRLWADIKKARFRSAKYIHSQFATLSKTVTALSSKLLPIFATQLETASLNRPTMLQHGDFSPSNVFVDPNGKLGVIDFESARWDDACCDIYYFCNWFLDESEDFAPAVDEVFFQIGKFSPAVLEVAAWHVWSLARWYDLSYFYFITALPIAEKKHVVEGIIDRGERLLSRFNRLFT